MSPDPTQQSYPTPYQPSEQPKLSFWKQNIGCIPIWALILIAVILFSLAISSGVAKYSTTGTSILAAQDAPTPRATTIVIPVATFATEQPTPIPTPSPTPSPTPNQHRYLGNAVPVFQAIYGHNGDTSLKGSVIWNFPHHQWFSITYDDSNQHVYDMNYYFYPAEDAANSQNYTVPLTVVRTACDGFKPPDSVLLSVKTNKPDPNLAPGIQYVYKSAWLGRQLDAY